MWKIASSVKTPRSRAATLSGVNGTLRQVAAALALIESRLFETVTLEELARAAHSSPWHFHRLFCALTGETPAGYVRKRRLSELCQRLVHSDEPIAQLSIRGGFESQASFTRAFSRVMGTTPARYRKRGVLTAAHRFNAMTADTLLERRERKIMEPRIEHKPAFTVVGMLEHVTPTTNHRIATLWGRFGSRMGEIAHKNEECAFGVCLDDGQPPGSPLGFRYVAAVEVDAIENVPPGMIAVPVPAATYAVFTHRGHITQIGDTIKQLWGEWLPASKYHQVPGPDFEYYDARYDPNTGNGEVDLYIPVAEDT